MFTRPDKEMVAEARVELAYRGYEPRKLPLLYSAILKRRRKNDNPRLSRGADLPNAIGGFSSAPTKAKRDGLV